MSDPDLQLSPEAQAILASHRDHRGPRAEQSERVWERVHQSAIALPLAGELASQAVQSAQGTTASAGVAKTAAAGTAAAKGGILGASTTKIALGLVLGGGAAGVGVATVRSSEQGGKRPDKVAPALRPKAQKRPSSRTFAERADALQRKTHRLAPPVAPVLASKKEASPVQKAAAPRGPASALTSELTKKLQLLEEIDAQLRRKAFKRAQQLVDGYRSHYPSSEFAKDIEAMQLMIDCAFSASAASARVSRVLGDRGYRRYWKRIRRACEPGPKKP